jgi:hypothetical protein
MSFRFLVLSSWLYWEGNFVVELLWLAATVKSCGCTEVRPAAGVIPTPRCTNPLRPCNYLSLAPACKACHVGAQLVRFACCCESQVTDFLTSTSTVSSVLTGFHISETLSLSVEVVACSADRVLSWCHCGGPGSCSSQALLDSISSHRCSRVTHIIVWRWKKHAGGPVSHKYSLIP